MTTLIVATLLACIAILVGRGSQLFEIAGLIVLTAAMFFTEPGQASASGLSDKAASTGWGAEYQRVPAPDRVELPPITIPEAHVAPDPAATAVSGDARESEPTPDPNSPTSFTEPQAPFPSPIYQVSDPDYSQHYGACMQYQGEAANVMTMRLGGVPFNMTLQWAAGEAYGPNGIAYRGSAQTEALLDRMIGAAWHGNGMYGRTAQEFTRWAFHTCMAGKPF